MNGKRFMLGIALPTVLLSAAVGFAGTGISNTPKPVQHRATHSMWDEVGQEGFAQYVHRVQLQQAQKGDQP